MEDSCYFRALRQPFRYPKAIFLMLRETHPERAEAAQAKPGIIRADAIAQLLCLAAQNLLLRAPGNDQAKHRIGMTNHIFCSGMNSDIDAVSQRPKKKRRGPGIVDDRGHAPFARDRGDSRDILYFKGKGAGGLEEDDAGVRPYMSGDRRPDARIIIVCFDAEAAQKAITKLSRGTIDAICDQNMVPLLHLRKQGDGNGSKT